MTLRDRDLFDVLYAAAIHNRPDIFDGLLAKLRKESGYNSDCVNNVLRIVNVGQYEMAFKILLSMKSLMTSEGKPMASGIYFIKQLVKSPAATSDVIAYCDRLAELGLNERAVNRAFEAAVELGRQDRCEMILKHIAAKQPIGPRFFWPLLVRDFLRFHVIFSYFIEKFRILLDFLNNDCIFVVSYYYYSFFLEIFQ